jgi:hypothetical protein
VSYRPREDGRAQIVASVVERPLAPSGAVPLAAMGLRALTDREVAVAIASPTGGGELWSASWRWWERRPRIALSLAAPAPFGGVWALEAADDRQTYGDPGGEIAERRRTIALRAADWLTGATRWEASAGVERWPSGYSQAISAGVEHRAAAGRLRLTGAATAMTGAIRTWTLQSGIAWTSAAANEGASVVARAGFEAAGDGAPLALWPGAGTGQGRDALLRAHPLLDDGVIRRGAFGRRLFHAGVEWRRWTAPSVRLVRLAPAIFLDVARAGSVPGFADGRFHADLGAGLRLALPGSGTLRVDVARGLRDGQMALSAGWVR